MSRNPLFFLVVMVLLFFIGPSAGADAPDDILVVANLSVEEKSIDLDNLRTIFLKKRKNWPNSGGKVVPVNARTGTDLRKRFLEKVLEMSAEEEQSYWENEKIKKGVSPPPEFVNNLKAVFHIKGSVTYIFRSQYRQRVSKILYVIPR